MHAAVADYQADGPNFQDEKRIIDYESIVISDIFTSGTAMHRTANECLVMLGIS